jgi:hypothetical protein
LNNIAVLGMIMQNFEVSELSRSDFIKWDSLVDSSLHGTIFHKSGWLDACAKSLGKKVKIFGCFDNGKLVGGCSLFISNMFGFFPIAESICSMTPYGGFVVSTSQKGGHKHVTLNQKITNLLINYIKQEPFFAITIRNCPDFPDIRPFIWNGWKSKVFYTYYFDLNGNIESRFDQSVKKNIRKAEKNKIIIETSTDISKYYSLLYDTYSRKDLKPPAPKKLLYELFSFIRNQNCGEMIIAKMPGGEITCGKIVIWDSHMAYDWTAASDSRFLNTGSTSLNDFDNFKRLQKRGFQRINIMMGNFPQLSEFASSFNPILVPYYQVQRTIFDIAIH